VLKQKFGFSVFTPHQPLSFSFLRLKGVKALLITAALSKSPLEQKKQDPSKDLRGHVSVALRKLHEATEKQGQPNEDLLKDCIAQIK